MDEKCREFVCTAGKIDKFSFCNEMLCFLCYYRLISRDLQESKTEVISSIGYKNMFISGIHRNVFAFFNDDNYSNCLHLQPRNGRRAIGYE